MQATEETPTPRTAQDYLLGVGSWAGPQGQMNSGQGAGEAAVLNPECPVAEPL